MGILYPNDLDVFSVPTLPEETSLSSAGTATRNHTQLHDDINQAVMALESNASLKTHDHSGANTIGSGPKLSQANTHQNADTDSAPTALHHTLGSGANQAAPGNHTHTVAQVPQHYRICTSTTRPTPYAGMMIFETDTNQVKVWASFGDTTGWHIIFGAPVVTPTPDPEPPPPPAPTPVIACRLRQNKNQKLSHDGTILEWHDELEDTLNFFNPAASRTSIVIRRAGLYSIDTALQWDPLLVPDVAKVAVCINGIETNVRNQAFMRGNLYTPGFSQTLAVTGKLQFQTDDVLTVKVSYEAPANLLGQIFSFVEGVLAGVVGNGSRTLCSRLDINYIGS